jgi:IclR family acetate operon transcriptional repressor
VTDSNITTATASRRGSQPTGEAKALVKGIATLNAVAARPAGMALTEIASMTELSKATAHRLLASLVDAGLVRALGEGRYALGSQCLVLGAAFLEGIDLRTEALSTMRELVGTTGETCHLGVLTGNHIVYVEKVDSPHSIRMFSRVGATNPAGTTALGKAILAFSPPDRVESVLADGIEQRTPRTTTDPGAFREALAEIRRAGFALDDIENEQGIRCIAAPIFDHQSAPIGGLSISGPEHRVTLDGVPNLAEQVRSAALEISRRLGYRRA